MSTVSGGAALVGRAQEVHRLRECARAVAAGSGALVLIDGEAGAGKSRLVAEVAKPPFLPRGFTVAVAAALDYAPAPYAPIRDAIVALDKRFPKVLASNPELAAELAPVLEFRALAGEADSARQRRLLDAVVEAVGAFAAQSPLVLAVEDAHWIDRASADVISHLARKVESMRAMLLVTFRPAEAGEAPGSQQLIGQLCRTATLQLSLKPLSPADSMVLIDEVAPARVPMDVRREICRLSDGNPLLLLEFTKIAAENPAAIGGALPITLKAIVAERLALFDAADVDVLRVAAAMGEFDPQALAEISAVAPQRVFATLRKARDASIIAESRSAGAPFVFRHALIRHAITEDLLGYESQDLHRRIAERLEAQPGSAQLHARLAHHFYLAGESEKSRRYNAIAADEALSVFAYSDAAQLLERALDARALDESTYELCKKLAETYSAVPRPEDALNLTERLFTFALERQDHTEAAVLGFELSRRRYRVFDDAGSMQAIRQTLEAIDLDDHPQAAFNLYATLAWYQAHLRLTEDAAATLAQAERYRASSDPEATIRYHEASAALKVHSGNVQTYRDDFYASLAIVRSQGSPAALARALDSAISLSMASNIDDIEFASECCRELWEIGGRGPVASFAGGLALSAWIPYLQGDLARARHVLNSCFAAAEEAPLVGFHIARTGIPLALDLDDPQLLRRSARPRLLEHAFASTSENVFGQVAAAVAIQLQAQNRRGEAIALVTHAVKRLRDGANNVPLLIEAARLNAPECADLALSMLAELKKESKSGAAGWNLARAYMDSADRRERAAEAAQGFRNVSWVMYEAQALEAAGCKGEALEIYRRSGAVGQVRRLESERPSKPSGELSKREWEVAQLVAQGKSNRAIAAELYLSERTVENHIASMFAKLNMRSRAEIASHVARELAKGD